MSENYLTPKQFVIGLLIVIGVSTLLGLIIWAIGASIPYGFQVGDYPWLIV